MSEVPSFEPFARQERLQVSRAVHHTKNFNSVRARTVKHEYLFKTGDPKNTQRFKTGVLEPRMPSHLGLCGEESKRLVGGDEEAVTGFWARFRGKVISLVVKVLVRLRTNDVASTHRVPVFLRRSSSRRCFSSQ